MTELTLHTIGAAGRQRLRTAWTVIAILPLLVAATDPGRFWQIIASAAQALLSTAPIIAIAVFLIALLKATGAENLVAKAFAGRELRMIVLAALVGGLAPFCSCEVIPFIAGLLAVGVPLAPVMAFWLSSPLIDPPALLITANALGWDYALGKTIAAVAIGLAGGGAIWLLTHQGLFASVLRSRSGGGCSSCGTAPFSSASQWRFWTEPARREIFRIEAIANSLFLLKWLTLAYLLEALLITYIPAETIGKVVGGGGFGAIIMGALVGAPAYLNGYAAPALVAGLIEQGMSRGAAMSFLVAGAISCIPAMVAVWSLVRWHVFASYVALGFAGAIAAGSLFQFLI
ncbi:MAG: permease [Acidiferrobacteraceae bacterium]|nr:permease [Acidiferrobacteraceae bacterium]